MMFIVGCCDTVDVDLRTVQPISVTYTQCICINKAVIFNGLLSHHFSLSKLRLKINKKFWEELIAYFA
jgi:hypothetical protein